MKKSLFLLVLCLMIAYPAYSDTYVSGYYKKDGTYVKPHYNKNSNNNFYNSNSLKVKVNPYTGEKGHFKYRRFRTPKVQPPEYKIEFGDKSYKLSD